MSAFLAGYLPTLPPVPRAQPVGERPMAPAPRREGRWKGRAPKDWYGWVSPSGLLRAMWRAGARGCEGYAWLFHCLACGGLVEMLPRRVAQGDVHTCGCGGRGGGATMGAWRRQVRSAMLDGGKPPPPPPPAKAKSGWSRLRWER